MIKINKDECINCGACSFVCESGALDFLAEEQITYNEIDCMGCYECIEECPQEAITKKEE